MSRLRKTAGACQVCTFIAPVLVGGIPGLVAGFVALVVLAIALALNDRALDREMRRRYEALGIFHE